MESIYVTVIEVKYRYEEEVSVFPPMFEWMESVHLMRSIQQKSL